MAQEFKTPEDDFVDPLQNFDPPEYDDPIQQALVDRQVSELQIQPFTAVTPDTTVEAAMKELVGGDVACLMVAKDDRLCGIFSDRDVLDKVALEYESVSQKPVSEFMESDPVFVYDTDSSAAALAVMAISGYRHVPVLNLSDRLVGILSPQRVTKFLRESLANC